MMKNPPPSGRRGARPSAVRSAHQGRERRFLARIGVTLHQFRVRDTFFSRQLHEGANIAQGGFQLFIDVGTVEPDKSVAPPESIEN